MKNFLLIFALLVPIYLMAQLPTTNIVLLDIDFENESIELTSPKFLTSFNINGYNNQPFFINEDELLISSSYQAKGKTDIYQLNLDQNSIIRLTSTLESEYSPSLLSDEHLSIVREELTESDVTPQFLWQYPIDRSNMGHQLLSKYENIGYYVALPDDQIALFLVGDPNKLVIVNTQTNNESFISYNIGRTLKYVDGALYYLQKLGNTWTIRKHDLNSDISKYVTRTMDKSEDFEVLSDGTIISASGSKLFYFDSVDKSGWKEIIDLSSVGVKNISRIAIKENKMAIVISD